MPAPQRPPLPAPAHLPRRVFVGAIVTPVSLLELRCVPRAVLGVGTSGVIRFVEDLEHWAGAATARPDAAAAAAAAAMAEQGFGGADADDPDPTPLLKSRAEQQRAREAAQQARLRAEAEREEKALNEVLAMHGWDAAECDVIRLEHGEFLCPGFVDTHTHPPQVPNLGLGQSYELLEWLEKITFPRERLFESAGYARTTYNSVVQRMLDSGTTCAAMYGTLHQEACEILADICNERGMRALVGKCNMDRNCPSEYTEKNASISIESTKNFIQHVRALRPYGEPPSVTSPDMRPSRGSLEMDASLARLSRTMNELMGEPSPDEQEGSQGGKGGSKAKGASSPPDADVSPLPSAALPLAGSPQASPTPARSRALHRCIDERRNAASRERKALSMRKQPPPQPLAVARAHGASTAVSPARVKALVLPILTPRFAIACSDALLAGLAALSSKDPTLRIQTHLSENVTEVEFTRSLYPGLESYTHIYDSFSLLTPRTILAHAIHLDDAEMRLIAKRKCGVSHCPVSNGNLSSGTSRVGEMLNRGIKVGLGSDASGGFSLGMLGVIREASVVAKVLNFSNLQSAAQIKEASKRPLPEHDGAEAESAHAAPQKVDFCKGPLRLSTLFYLATLGGAEVCSLSDSIGSLDVGKEFDALLVRTTSAWDPEKGYTGSPGLYIEPEDALPALFEKWLFAGSERNLASVFVRGRCVGGTTPIA